MCEHQCYLIGGPFIAENPDCPVHGRAALRTLTLGREELLLLQQLLAIDLEQGCDPDREALLLALSSRVDRALGLE